MISDHLSDAVGKKTRGITRHYCLITSCSVHFKKRLVRYFDSRGCCSSILIFARISALGLSEYVTSPQCVRAVLPQTYVFAGDLLKRQCHIFSKRRCRSFKSSILAVVASGIAAELKSGIVLRRVLLLVEQTRQYCSSACWCRGSRRYHHVGVPLQLLPSGARCKRE